MRKQTPALKIYLCAALVATLVGISGCGGSKTLRTPDTSSAALSPTPPPIGSNNHWHASFEESEGYTLGNLVGQNGWTEGWDPRPGEGSAVVSSDMAATGTRCLKMLYRSSSSNVWWQNMYNIVCPIGLVPDVPCNAVTFRMTVYRDPGETEYPAGSGVMHPNIWCNQFGYVPEPRYVDFGDAGEDMKLHALLWNADPDRVWDDPGWDQIAGRFVEIVIRDDYTRETRTVWYDGQRVASVPISNPTKTYQGFTIFCQALNPGVPAELGKPIYVDDIDLSWEPAFPQ